MEKANWLIISGKAELKESTIKYIPLIQKNKLGIDENTPSFVSSNIEFEAGEISFKVILKDKFGLCQVILGTDTGSDLNVGINTSGKLFGITKFDRQSNKWEIVSGSASAENLEIGKEYNIRISVNGSIVKLFVDEIQVAYCIHEIRQTQLQIVFSSVGEIIVKDFRVKKIKPKAFVVMQFTEEYNELYNEVIKPVCEDYGIECERADDYHTTNMIIEDIVASIISASVVIAEITPDNPNVFYEVGYSHAINKPTILLCEKKKTKLPFDLSSFRTLFYDNTIAGKTQVEKKLRKYLQTIFKK
ncbi:MAG: nucleoside 2-deoxyribosyltransferase [Bacteroidales bacterium]|nr:nucleoside 2-deoxyribosyltransferase [Bacteroidales bacterium]